MKVLVTGAAGQLGYDVVNELTGRGITAVGTDIRDENDLTEKANWSQYVPLDITDRDAVEKTVEKIAPDAIIHCAAWTNVDGAEDEKNRPTVKKINVDGTENLALAAKKAGCKFLYISTDYVFDGTGERPWQPDDARFAPQNWYGETKLQGEIAVSTLLEKYFIVRIAWVFGKNGKNFVKTMLTLGKDKPTLKVVFDQVGSPTCARDLARAIVTVMSADEWHGGIYHYSNEGVISWYDFTKAIHRLAGITTCDVQPCHSDEFPAKAHRPAYSVLDKTKFKTTFGVTVPYWLDSLQDTLKQLKTNN